MLSRSPPRQGETATLTEENVMEHLRKEEVTLQRPSPPPSFS